MPNVPECIIIHHSATADGVVNDWTAIRRYHMDTNGWRDVAYHYGVELVGSDYQIQLGRKESEEGAHTLEESMNFKSVGICLVGDFDKNPPPEKQLSKLYDIIRDIYKRYNKPFPIRMHREFANYKSCPGKMFPIDQVRSQAEKIWADIQKPADLEWKEAVDEWSRRKLANGDPVIGSPVQWQAKLLGQLVDSESVRWLLKKTYRYVKENKL